MIYDTLFAKKLKNGDYIRITWLPMNNAYPHGNTYEGSYGFVEDLQMDGSCSLRMESGAVLVLHGHYKWEPAIPSYTEPNKA